MACPDLVPPGGLKFYQLGIEGNEHYLKKYLNKTGIEDVTVADAASEERVQAVCRKMDASRAPDDKAPLIIHIVTSEVDRDEELMSVLSLGVCPWVSTDSGETATLLAIENHNFDCARSLLACRPWDNHDDDGLVACRDKANDLLRVGTMDRTNTEQNALTSNTSGAITLKSDISRTRPRSPNLIVNFYG